MQRFCWAHPHPPWSIIRSAGVSECIILLAGISPSLESYNWGLSWEFCSEANYNLSLEIWSLFWRGQQRTWSRCCQGWSLSFYCGIFFPLIRSVLACSELPSVFFLLRNTFVSVLDKSLPRCLQVWMLFFLSSAFVSVLLITPAAFILKIIFHFWRTLYSLSINWLPQLSLTSALPWVNEAVMPVLK